LNKMKDKLFSIIAHDLKNPFNTVLGFSDLLLDGFQKLSDDKKLKYIELINTSSKKIFNLLDNLLFWSRAQINLIPFNPEKLNYLDIVQQNSKLLEADYWKKNISMETNIPSSLMIFGDKNMINMVTRNLLSNAVKYSHTNSKIYIHHTFIENMVEIQITDKGVGISQENIDKLFQIGNSFQRAGTSGEEGSGLGLLLCKDFIEKHGGKMSVYSVMGKGSTFGFTLPFIAS
jgi:signal transduction histidine kinase